MSHNPNEFLTCVLGITYSDNRRKSYWRKIKSEIINVSVANANECLIAKSGRKYVVRAKESSECCV